MKVSFTGTKHGMTKEQKKAFCDLIGTLKPEIFIHGDCIGADADAHDLIQINFKKVLIHKRPADIDQSKRAFCDGGEIINEPKPPLERNRDIVNDGELLIATPGEHFEELRSGTWATIRYAKKNDKPVIIIWPNGVVLK